MITVCPQCKTRFNVSPEQLAARQGLVRCGRCATVFNGFAALQGDGAPAIVPAPNAPESTTSSKSTAAAAAVTPTVDSSPASEHELAPRVPAPSPPEVAPECAGEPMQEQDEATTPEKDLVGVGAPETPAATPAAFEEAPSTPGTEIAWPALELSGESMPLGPIGEPGYQGQEPHAPAEPGAMPERGKPIEWPSIIVEGESGQLSPIFLPFPVVKAPVKPESAQPKKAAEAPLPATADDELLQYEPELLLPLPHSADRRGWVAATVVLAVVLGLQGIFLLRNDIVATWPDSYPSLQAVCTRIGCSIALPRQIDQITIESSELRADPDRGNLIVLTALLRSRAPMALEFPWLEVTLTDTFDRPVARRSLAPKDYLARPPDRDEGMAAGSELTVKVGLDPTDTKASGYKLRLYYP